MPPFSRHVDEEGILFEDFELVSAGELRETALRAALAGFPLAGPQSGPQPRRPARPARGQCPRRRRSCDGRCGTGACRRWSARCSDVQDNAAAAVAAAIVALGDRRGRREVPMDDGPRIVVEVELDATLGRARIDFSGTSAAGAHNFNAPRAVCLAAVLYVFRTLVERPIPLNEGCLAPLEIVIPPGSLLDPPPGSAVVAGNVETSQVIVDALYGALGVLAASQGTMNNLTFGDAALQYYETIAGGSGAGAGFDGCDAVQTHMTNSRLTDPEILEQRYPVRVREFAIRRGIRRPRPPSRRRRRAAPHRVPGPDGGRDAREPSRRRGPSACTAAAKASRVRRVSFASTDGSRRCRPAPHFASSAGDAIEVSTPGGGGWGR